jgi:spermidine synthase
VKSAPPALPATLAATSPALSAAQRIYLYFTAAVTGAAVMVVEILGAKMLAPYVGTSHFVWTAQIAVTMAALASGYYVGGWIADLGPKPSRMYFAILLAAAYLCLTVVIVEPIAYRCLTAQLAIGSLLASAVLFFIPLALLAMTGPFFVRVLTVSVSGVGGSVGRLTAIGTAGSLGGTILIGYVLIPFFRNSVTMYVTAAALLAVCLIYFLIWGRRQLVTAIGTAAIAVALTILGVMNYQPYHTADATEIFQTNSNFGQIQVVDGETSYGDRKFHRRAYLNDFLTQNTYDVDQKQSMSMFSYMLHGLAHAYTPKIDDALCIGMGVGIVPMKLAGDGARVDVIEINPSVVPVAQRFFDFDPTKVNVIIGDGRQYMNVTTKKYDAVVLDAFLGDSSPSHLMSREAFTAVQRLLKPNGVLVINSFGDLAEGKDFFVASLDKTLKSVFQSVRIHCEDAGSGNIFFVATDRPNAERLHNLDIGAIHPYREFEVVEAFNTIKETNPKSGIVLTDDFNPVEYYDASNREDFRKYLASAMLKKK